MYADGSVKQDLRREPRVPADGIVVLEFEGRQLRARLVDLSHSGFRAAHDYTRLSNGDIVHFRHPSGAGHARVVWNRISGGTVESGFFIIP